MTTMRGTRGARWLAALLAGVGLVAMPTLVAGVYGMNFQHMPELGWLYGYPFSIALMVLSSAGLWVFFKKSGWL